MNPETNSQIWNVEVTTKKHVVGKSSIVTNNMTQIVARQVTLGIKKEDSMSARLNEDNVDTEKQQYASID